MIKSDTMLRPAAEVKNRTVLRPAARIKICTILQSATRIKTIKGDLFIYWIKSFPLLRTL